MGWTEEIQAGPLAASLAPFVEAGDMEQVRDMLNAKTIDVVRSVDGLVFLGWAAYVGILSKIYDFSVEINHPLRNSSLALLLLINRGGKDSLDLYKNQNLDMLAGWVSLGELTAPHRDELIALATMKISRVEQVSGDGASISLNEVVRAIYKDDGNGRNW